MNLGDPELELIDPTPNVHNLFLYFDKVFFCTKLASRAVVRWSKRMYSSAGICSYEGYGGLCNISLSEPLLKLRPRKDLIETLLHEMIHAYLFITNRDRDRDGHGPNFQAHMHRINKCAGLNISIYHDFHDEVKLYLTHWWRCNGPCQTRKPYFGIVRRTANRVPGPRDYWWEQHKRSCGGTFVKIKEPEQRTKKAAPKKPNADITKFVTTFKKTSTGDINRPIPNSKGILKDSNSIPARPVIVTKKGVVYNPQPIFNGADKSLIDNVDIRQRSNSVAVMETVRNVWANKQLTAAPSQINNNNPLRDTVRNVWANKQLPSVPSQINNNKPTQKAAVNTVINNKKHKSDNLHVDSPPSKVKKIDDYFKSAATVLKDLYGQDFNVRMSKDEKKLVALPVKSQMNAVTQEDTIDCPVCNLKVKSNIINRHLDECLNKEVISDLCDYQSVGDLLNMNIKNEDNSLKKTKTNDNNIVKTKTSIKTEPVVKWVPSVVNNDTNKAKELSIKNQLNERIHSIDLTNLDSVMNTNFSVNAGKPIRPKLKAVHSPTFDDNYINRAKEIANQMDKNKRRSVDFTNLNPVNNFNTNKTIKIEQSNDVFKTLADNEINSAREMANKIKQEKQFKKSDSFTSGFKDKQDIRSDNIKIEPGTSRSLVLEIVDQICPCCDKKINRPIEEHLDECLAFFDNNTTIPGEGALTGLADQAIIVIDDDNDMFDETLTLNATGTKYPCPCCLEMVEQAEMNWHLDNCLS